MFSSDQIRILTPQGFHDCFEKNLKNHSTFKAAYEATEQAHKNIIGKRHYSSYNSFRTSIKKSKAKIIFW